MDAPPNRTQAIVPHLRQVRDSHEFMEDIKRVFAGADPDPIACVRIGDSILNEIKWVLAREPQSAGLVLLRAGVWLLKTYPVHIGGGKRQPLLILLSYDAEQVEMLRLA